MLKQYKIITLTPTGFGSRRNHHQGADLCLPKTLCVLLFLLSMPDCWLEVSIRKVLRPTTSTQVFLGFPVSISEC